MKMEDSSIFEALQRAGADSVDCDYEEAKPDGWRTIDDLAELGNCGRSTITRLMRSGVAAGTWETKKVRLSAGRKAAAYREISADKD
jgi:predicted transcriptional regulator